MHNVDEETYHIITKQLGRRPRNLLGVAFNCPFGKPAVLLTSPYKKGKEIFPTTYWLSCPHLVKEVSRLESKGLIKELTARMKADLHFQERMEKANEKYANQRMALLSGDEIDELKNVSPDIYQVLKNSGVGGIRDKGGIKCLHTHLADYLVNRQNPVGEIVYKLIDWPEQCDYELEEEGC